MCTGANAKQCSKRIAIFQIIITSILLLFLLPSLPEIFRLLHADNNDLAMLTLMVPWLMGSTGISFLAAFPLRMGVAQNNVLMCKLWYWITVIGMVISYLGILRLFFIPGSLISLGLSIVINLYFLSVVSSYIEELEQAQEERLPCRSRNVENQDQDQV